MHPFQNDIAALRSFLGRAVLGKDDVIELVLVNLVAQGHLLIEDVPGVGKTTLALALARSIDGTFQRIQFTSDLLPSDVLGVQIYNSEKHNFEFKPGPIFANVVLADEINRTTPKSQSALLEAMQDGRVSMERTTYDLPRPFTVLATQNPIEFHGTYPLPESQLDRFLMRITMGYPPLDQEMRILQTKEYVPRDIKENPVCTGARVLEMQRAVSEVRVDRSVAQFVLSIIEKTRRSRDLELGASPRGSLALYRAAQARAFVRGELFVTPDDVKSLVVSVLAHRVLVSGRRAGSPTSADARSAAETILKEIVETVEVPV
ncbi:MAG TPA: MoxR family ATPase [Bdellovibrionota bacterium]|nr:MoxR family ATPase [Bdellovibrionota bacterium]